MPVQLWEGLKITLAVCGIALIVTVTISLCYLSVPVCKFIEDYLRDRLSL